jgi:hypothetical protein
MKMSVIDVLQNILNYPVTINAAPMYSKTYAANNTVPFWLLVATFCILFAVVWIASSYITLFKDAKNKGARSMFAIAVSFIALFGTPLAIWILKVVYTFTLLSIIAVLILGAYIIWTLTKSGWAESAKTNAESGQTLADAKKKNGEIARQNDQTNAYNKATKFAAARGIHAQLSEIKVLKQKLKRLLSDFYRIKKKNHFPVNTNDLNRLARDVSIVKTDYGKVESFKTNNDRIMSVMSNRDYDTTNDTGLPRRTPPANTASLRAEIESQTADLGHSISAISDAVQTGIPTVVVMNNVINWTESAINITNRMERDIVLEKQYIEKI